MFQSLFSFNCHASRPFFSTRLSLLYSRLKTNIHCKFIEMATNSANSNLFRPAKFRLCNVSGYMTELLEIQAPNPTMHVLIIPGNPGIISFYKDFVESLYEQLSAKACWAHFPHKQGLGAWTLIFTRRSN
ncbi:Lipid droplet-associated hydrolase [Bienertia sinuspersici]